MKHLFCDVEKAMRVIENLKALEPYIVELQGVPKRNIFDSGEICKDSLVENPRFRAILGLLEVQSADKQMVTLSHPIHRKQGLPKLRS